MNLMKWRNKFSNSFRLSGALELHQRITGVKDIRSLGVEQITPRFSPQAPRREPAEDFAFLPEGDESTGPRPPISIGGRRLVSVQGPRSTPERASGRSDNDCKTGR